jgi:DNA-binding CsgD family transcriptional regulator
MKSPSDSWNSGFSGPRPRPLAVGWLVITNIAADIWRAQFLAQTQVIGRGSTSAIRVPPGSQTVSRSHARIWADRHLWIADLHSTAGTRINGVKIVPDHPKKVHIADRIALGSLELTVIGQPHRDSIHDDDPSIEDSGVDTSIRRAETSKAAAFSEFLLTSLTEAERDVVLWMARGYVNDEELGKKLHCSPNTIRTHVGSIFQKLGLHSRNELLALLMQLNHPDAPPTP